MILIALALFSIFRRITNLFLLYKNTEQQYDPDRRGFLASSMNFGIIGLSGSLSGYGLFDVRDTPDIVNVQIPLDTLHDDLHGFRIVQITDLHVGPTIKRSYVQNIVDRVMKLKADMIVLTGDIADGSVSYLREDVAPLKDLSAPWGKYSVTGNHEYYSGVHEWIDEVDRLGYKTLLNAHESINVKDGKLLLAGVTDYRSEFYNASHVSSPEAAISDTDIDGPKILLAHQPRSIFAASNAGFDLQISGHTHGGQYIPWNFVAEYVHPYTKGLHRHDKTWIYVSRGTGYWGPPIRLGVPSEITVIRLIKNGSSPG